MIDSTPVGDVFASAEQLYLAIRTSGGPHVTPELFAVHGNLVVCMTAATSLKAKSTKRDQTVAIAARVGSTAVAAVGTVDVVDPARPISALAAPTAAVVGAAQFVRENALEMLGAARDALGGRLGLPPPHRVLLAVTLDAAIVLDEDKAMWTSGWGGRDGELADEGTPRVHGGPAADPDLSGMPEHIAKLMEPGPVVVGWMAEDGRPLALPGRWEADGVATISAAVFEVTRAAVSSRACATFDAWSGFGPSGKRGLLLRGSGRARRRHRHEPDRVEIAFDIERATGWDGVQIESVEIEDDGGKW